MGRIRKRWWVLGLVLGTMLALVGLNLYLGFQVGRPIDYQRLSPSNPLRDQLPSMAKEDDLWLAADAIYRQSFVGPDLTPRLVSILPVVNGQEPDQAALEQTLQITADPAIRFLSFEDLQNQTGLTSDRIRECEMIFSLDDFRAKPETLSDWRKIIAAQASRLDSLSDCLAQPGNCYWPMITVLDWTYPSYLMSIGQQFRVAGVWVKGRCLVRMADGQWEDAWQDIATLFRMAKHAGRIPGQHHATAATFLHGAACQLTHQWLNQPSPSEASLRTALQQLPTLAQPVVLADAWEPAARVAMMQKINRLVQGQMTEQEYGMSTELIPYNWIDANQLVDQWDQRFAVIQDLGHRMGEPDACQQLKVYRESWGEISNFPSGSLPGLLVGIAPRKASTDFFGQFLFPPELPEMLERQTRMISMYRMSLLAAAIRTDQVQQSQWPKTLQEVESLLPAGTFAQLTDPYTGQPYQWQVLPEGAAGPLATLTDGRKKPFGLTIEFHQGDSAK